MSQQSFWLLVAFLGYSSYSAVIGRVTAFVRPRDRAASTHGDDVRRADCCNVRDRRNSVCV